MINIYNYILSRSETRRPSTKFIVEGLFVVFSVINYRTAQRLIPDHHLLVYVINQYINNVHIIGGFYCALQLYFPS